LVSRFLRVEVVEVVDGAVSPVCDGCVLVDIRILEKKTKKSQPLITQITNRRLMGDNIAFAVHHGALEIKKVL
jgi:hypothetical protein